MDRANNWQIVFTYEFREQYLGLNDAQILISGEELWNFLHFHLQRSFFKCLGFNVYIVTFLPSALLARHTCPLGEAYELTCLAFDIDGRLQKERHGDVYGGVLRSAAGVWRQLTAVPLTELGRGQSVLR